MDKYSRNASGYNNLRFWSINCSFLQKPIQLHQQRWICSTILFKWWLRCRKGCAQTTQPCLETSGHLWKCSRVCHGSRKDSTSSWKAALTVIKHQSRLSVSPLKLIACYIFFPQFDFHLHGRLDLYWEGFYKIIGNKSVGVLTVPQKLLLASFE